MRRLKAAHPASIPGVNHVYSAYPFIKKDSRNVRLQIIATRTRSSI
ncbi:MAG: hypothetical protein JSS06_02070 [Proteobacteria bacterium]|nr:hypothetical protein [Pseudomonadota bacterium]